MSIVPGWRNPDLGDTKVLSQMCPWEPESPTEFIEILEKMLDFLQSMEYNLNQSYLNYQGRIVLFNIWVMASNEKTELVMVLICK